MIHGGDPGRILDVRHRDQRTVRTRDKFGAPNNYTRSVVVNRSLLMATGNVRGSDSQRTLWPWE